MKRNVRVCLIFMVVMLLFVGICAGEEYENDALSEEEITEGDLAGEKPIYNEYDLPIGGGDVASPTVPNYVEPATIKTTKGFGGTQYLILCIGMIAIIACLLILRTGRVMVLADGKNVAEKKVQPDKKTIIEAAKATTIEPRCREWKEVLYERQHEEK